MTSIAVTLNAQVVTTDVKEIILDGRDLAGVRTWEVLLLNEENEFDGDWDGADVADINISGSNMLDGYIDDWFPYTDRRFVGLPLMKVIGRCNGFDIASLSHEKKYANEKIDDMFDDVLSSISSEITYTSPSTGTELSFEFDDTIIQSGFKQSCERQSFTYYVTNGKVLHLFPVGDVGEHLALNLTLNGALTDNIIRLKKGVYSSDIFNWVKLDAGPVYDHWTDLNASAFTPGASCSVTDIIVGDESPDDFFGKGKIRFTVNIQGIISGELDFNGGLYEYTVLDLSERDFLSYMAFPNFDLVGTSNRIIRIRLTDSSGNVIEFRRHISFLNPSPRENRTDVMIKERWVKVEVPHGEGLDIGTSGENEKWGFVGGAVAFNWDSVEKIGWTTTSNAVSGGYFDIDLLEIPTIKCISIAEDAASQAASKRKDFPKNRFDIKNQVELDAESLAILTRKKDKYQKLTLICEGQVDIKYPGQSLDVQSIPYGISSLTKYRILSFTHRVTTAELRFVDGYDFTTELNLIQDEVGGNTQESDVHRETSSLSMTLAWNGSMEEYRIMLDSRLRELRANLKWGTQPAEVPSGDTFPTDPLDGDYFRHTGWGRTFAWDSINARWVSMDYGADATAGVTADSGATGVTADREQAGMTADQEQAGMTADQEQAGMTADREPAAMTADREQAGMTADREVSGVISDDADDRSIPDRQVTENIFINISNAWTVIMDRTPSDDSEEMMIFVTGRARDATPNDLFVRVLAGASNYPSTIGVKHYVTNQYDPLSWSILIPRNTNGIRVRVYAKHVTVTERWDLRAEYQLHDIHTHDITEPNAGAGHDTDLDEPNSGQGHDTDLDEPNSGQGHDTALNEPNGGAGHTTGLNEPGGGAGHNTGLNEPNAGQGHDTDLDDPEHDHDMTEPGGGAGHGEGAAADGHDTYKTTDPP